MPPPLPEGVLHKAREKSLQEAEGTRPCPRERLAHTVCVHFGKKNKHKEVSGKWIDKGLWEFSNVLG